MQTRLDTEDTNLHQEMQGLREQLGATRRQVRLLCSGMLALALVGGTWLASLPAESEEKGTRVKAPFRVVDDQGRDMLLVETDESGRSVLLFDDAGALQVALHARPGRGGVAVMEGPRPLASLEKDEDGGALWVRTAEGGTSATLWGTKDGGRLRLSGPGEEMAVLLSSEEEGGRLRMFGLPGEEARVGLGVNPEGGAQLRLRSRDGDTWGAAGMVVDGGDARVIVSDEELDGPGAQLVRNRGGAALLMQDQSGMVRTQRAEDLPERGR